MKPEIINNLLKKERF